MADGSEAWAAVEAWVARHVQVNIGDRKGFACHLAARAVLPLSAALMYELLTHPYGAQIFRGIDACTYRKILSDDSCGRLLVDVENVSVWRLLFFSGRIATRMLVSQDYHSGKMSIRVKPGQEGPRTPGCKAVPIEDLEAHWSIRPLSECIAEAAGILPDIPPESMERVDEQYCFVSLEQSISPWGIPRFLHGAFKSFARNQVVQTFEDVLMENHRIRQGMGTLCPYEEVCMKDITPEEGLAALERRDTAAAQGVGSSECPQPPRSYVPKVPSMARCSEDSSVAGSSAEAAHAKAPNGTATDGSSSGSAGLRRKRSLRGHRLKESDWWEMELDEIESESGRSVEGSCTPMEEGAFSDTGSDVAAMAALQQQHQQLLPAAARQAAQAQRRAQWFWFPGE